MSEKSIEKDNIQFLLLEGIHESAVKCLNKEGYTNVRQLSYAPMQEELKELIRDVHFLGVRSRTRLTEDVFEHANKLIGVGCFCIGTNQVALQVAANKGISVFNAPYSNTRSVAELVLGEAILLLRKVPSKNAAAHRGEWTKSSSGSFEIRGKKLGVVGYGNIGSQLGVMAESLGMQVYFYDVETKLPLGNSSQVDDLDVLLGLVDVVTLHVPESSETKNIINEATIAMMRPNSILINASRGTVVDIDAMVLALKSGKLSGAAIDVFPKEPSSNDKVFDSPLREFDNVILTPHIGGSTLEAQENIGKEVASKLIKYSDTGTSISSVNFPQVALPPHPGKHRILHTHKNIPGVLSSINQIFSENSINISGQYLQTNESIGYVVIDVDTDQSRVALEKIKSVKGTIRSRVLY